ncbi:MAG: DNA-protecting protein DprA [Chloroflexi bacterium]|nr:DNA-protecting protein DprA [Chloroflexota bacterium]
MLRPSPVGAVSIKESARRATRKVVVELEERLAWVGLSMVKGIGPARFRRLYAHFGCASAAWNAPLSALQAAGLPPAVAAGLEKLRRALDLPGLWARWQQKGIQVLTWEDMAYPQRLKALDHAPPVLYLRGQLLPEDDWAVAVVGTRKMTPYGHQVAEAVAALLAEHGVTVVSGLARGVDAVAHRAALRSGGRTLAVLGSGVDRIYPPEHRHLAEEIANQGALLSEYPPGTKPEANNFPPRNRIIAGLSLATVVVEAGRKSGALITAAFAAEQGREVFAVPGNIFVPQSQGTNWLLAQGAQPLTAVEDVLSALDLDLLPKRQAARKALPADPIEAKVLACLGPEPLHVDEISAQSGLPVAQVSATLALLELKGLAQAVGGMKYVAAL